MSKLEFYTSKLVNINIHSPSSMDDGISNGKVSMGFVNLKSEVSFFSSGQ